MNSKRNIFIQHDGMRMNPDFLSPEWKDDEINMSDNQSSDDNTIDYKKKHHSMRTTSISLKISKRFWFMIIEAKLLVIDQNFLER